MSHTTFGSQEAEKTKVRLTCLPTAAPTAHVLTSLTVVDLFFTLLWQQLLNDEECLLAHSRKGIQSITAGKVWQQELRADSDLQSESRAQTGLHLQAHPCDSNKTPPPQGSMTFPNSTTSWKPSAPMWEPMGDIPV